MLYGLDRRKEETMALTKTSKNYLDLRCKSTDPDPNPELYDDNQALFETDTFKVWFLDKSAGKWIRKDGEVRS